MPRGYRLALAVLVGFLIAAAPSPERDGASGEQQKAEQSIARSLEAIARTLNQANEAPDPNTPCRSGEDNRNSDLCAQWKAADASAESALWTERTFYLGIVGALIGAATLAAAVAAAKFAHDAAREAKRGANETKRSADAFIDAERAWLVVDHGGGRASPDAATVHVEINGILRGRMGAEIVGIHWTRLSDTTFPGEEAFTCFEDRGTVWDAPGMYHNIGMITLPVDATFVGGWVSYRIGFPGERRSYFLFKLEKGSVDAAGWSQYGAARLQRPDWPEDT